jgi:hypothetical protein
MFGAFIVIVHTPLAHVLLLFILSCYSCFFYFLFLVVVHSLSKFGSWSLFVVLFALVSNYCSCSLLWFLIVVQICKSSIDLKKNGILQLILMINF